MNGADWLLSALAAEGMPVLFGNPGSTELPITDALGRRPGTDYVLGLHEAVVMGMADGHARVTGPPGGGQRPRAARPGQRDVGDPQRRALPRARSW